MKSGTLLSLIMLVGTASATTDSRSAGSAMGASPKAASSQGWSDGFESYTTGSFPSATWNYSGNSDISVTTSTSAAGGKSLRMHGVVGGNWAAVLHRQLTVSPPYTIEYSVRNGTEPFSGRKVFRSCAVLFSGPSWTYSGFGLACFGPTGVFYAGDEQSISVPPLTWTRVRITYERPDTTHARVSYWLNDKFYTSITRTLVSNEDAAGWLTFTAEEGSAWFDEIKVTPLIQSSSSCVSNATADFRGNGRSDVIIYNPISGDAWTGLSSGSGSFAYVPQIFTPAFDTLCTGLFDGGAQSDLVLYNSKTALAYLGLGNGSGGFTFQSLFWSAGFDRVRTGDLNSDGRTDIILYRSSDGTMYTAVSNGNGGFTYRYNLVSIGFTHIRLADFSGDGNDDVFLYRSTDGAAYVGTSLGDGRFTFAPYAAAGGFETVESGDFDGDRRSDLAFYSSTTGAFRTALSIGSAFLTSTQSFSPGFTAVRLLDLNADGKSDVLLYNLFTSIGYSGIGVGNGTFTFGSLFWGYGIDVADPKDLNGDGNADVVLYNSSTGTSFAAIGNGAGGFSYTYSYWGPGRTMASGR